MKRLLIIGVVIFTSTSLVAQSFYSVRRDRTLIFSAGSGTSTYFGELSNPGDYLDAKPNLNVGLQYFFLRRVGIRTEINWFQLAGFDSKANEDERIPRNLSFVSDNYEISLTGAVSLMPAGSRFYQRPLFNIYAFAGIGVAYINPKAELNGSKVALQPLMTEGVKYSRTNFVIPYGLGAKIKAGPFFNVALEGGYRLTFTDYLDDVSTVHPDKSTWTDPVRIALSDRRPEYDGKSFDPGRQRGNPKTNDGYFLLNLKIEYFLPHNFIFKRDQNRRFRTKGKIMYKKRR